MRSPTWQLAEVAEEKYESSQFTEVKAGSRYH